MTELSHTAQRIFDLKYARTKKDGTKETWGECATRVAEYVSRAEIGDAAMQYMADWTKLIYDKTFIPGGRILANAGTGIKNMMNCFVLPIQDSRSDIYRTLGYAAEIFAWGGGIGYNFSNIREEGAPVVTTGGSASGPLSFMELFDTTGEVISQASRRGAQMGILNDSHPDILKFIDFKNALNHRNTRILDAYISAIQSADNEKILQQVLSNDQLTHFNISVALSDAFMDAYLNKEKWDLVSPHNNEIVKSILAEKLLQEIARNAWTNGDPGIYFIDRANEDNLVPYLGELSATNPCGEVPLLPYEACCLGSLNLFNFVEGQNIDFNYLGYVIELAIRFLDDVQELNETPIKEVNIALRKTRRLGLGIMGWADTLAEMELAYDSPDAKKVAEVVAKFIQKRAWDTSEALAKEKGEFLAYDKDNMNWTLFERQDRTPAPIRNVACTSIAPTGTIALLADVNSGIEPFFSRKYIRNITQGIGNVAKDKIDTEIKLGVLKTAHEIDYKGHIDMQAIWQLFTDNAVSKTINFSAGTSWGTIMEACLYGWNQDLKGITVYRNRSRGFQILNDESEE